LGRAELSRCAQGILVLAFNARSGPVPLPLGGSVVGLALGVGRGWGADFSRSLKESGLDLRILS